MATSTKPIKRTKRIKPTALTKAAETRYNYRLLKIERINQRLAEGRALDPPTVPAIIPGYDGLLPVSTQGAELDVTVASWETVPPGYFDVLDVMLAYEGGTPAAILHVEITDSDSFPMTLQIQPGDFKNEGNYQLTFQVTRWSGSDDTASIPLIVDKTPPYGAGNPVALDVPVGVITQEYLTDHDDKLICTLPVYADKAPGDSVAVYWEDHVPNDPSQEVPVFGPVEVDSLTDNKIEILRATIAAKRDGLNYVLYVLLDKAGNISRLSLPFEIDLELAPLPTGLKSPEVPLAADGLIDLEDAYQQVVVEIPTFTNPDNCFIDVTWGSTALAPVPAGIDPFFPLQVRVPWATLRDEYADRTGEVPITVSYQARRGTLVFPTTPLTVGFNVDLSVIGPDNPGDNNPDPDPINTTLAKVEVKGENSQTANTLTPADKGQDATATVALYTPVEDGEILKLYWGDGQTPAAEHTVAGEVADDPITFIIPWNTIYEWGNDPALAVWYTIEGPGANNHQTSPTTFVDVSADTVDLAAPSFPDAGLTTGGQPVLNCTSLYGTDHGIRVKVPGNSRYLKGGEEVVVNWQGYDFSGTVPVDDSKFSETVTLDAGGAAAGVIIIVQPYDPHILSIREGLVKASYTIVIDAVTVPSAEASILLGVMKPGGDTCDLT